MHGSLTICRLPWPAQPPPNSRPWPHLHPTSFLLPLPAKTKPSFSLHFSPHNSKPQWRNSQFDPTITPFFLAPLIPTVHFSTQFQPLAWFLAPISFDWASGFSVASRRRKTSRAAKRLPLFFLGFESMNRSELGPFRNLKTIRALEMGLVKWVLIRIGRRGRMFPRGINWLAPLRLPSLFATWIRFVPLFLWLLDLIERVVVLMGFDLSSFFEVFLWDFFPFLLWSLAGEFKRCYNSNVAPVWVEFFCGWIGSVIFLLGLCSEPAAWWVACQDIWWEVSN